MDTHSIYLHIPFCQQRCGYCDFNTYAGISDLIEPYVDALVKEIAACGKSARGGVGIPVHTVFLGGGTPSLLTPKQVTSLIEAVKQQFALLPGAEISMEANPGTVSQSSLAGYRQAGVNRLSIGVQSANADELRLLERQHGYVEAQEAVRLSREAGFEQISFDLIYGLPGQQISAWEHSLNAVLDLAPNHLSLYALSVERGTPLDGRVTQGLVSEPDPDVAADIYEWTIEYLAGLGWQQYEISNWAQRDENGELMVSRHNLQYWLNQPYFGFGAGAHGYISGLRTENEMFPASYIRAINEEPSRDYPQTPATINATEIDRYMEMQETMMMGLRLVQHGVSRERFLTRFGEDFTDVFSAEIKELLMKSLLEWTRGDEERLRLTKHARILGNQVFQYFV
ncbi:MAG: radical SAM family heme chaperone HemW [Chloroflexota bacterium]